MRKLLKENEFGGFIKNRATELNKTLKWNLVQISIDVDNLNDIIKNNVNEPYSAIISESFGFQIVPQSYYAKNRQNLMIYIYDHLDFELVISSDYFKYNKEVDLFDNKCILYLCIYSDRNIEIITDKIKSLNFNIDKIIKKETRPRKSGEKIGTRIFNKKI